MAKNIPITARVSKGLFGQKVTEPVLNVGQAGAYGNNVTKRDPSPAKMMNSPFKQQVNKSKGPGDLVVEQGQANANIGSKEPDTVIKGKEKTKPVNTDTYDGSGGYASDKDWNAFLETPKGKAYLEKNTKQVGTGEFEPDKTIKGKDKTKKIPLRTYNEGSAKTSYWRRQDDRAVTHTSRKKKRADIKLAELEAKEKGYKGKKKREHISNAKNKAKKEMWESRQAGYKGSREAAVLQSEQSARVHDKILGVHINRDKEEVLDTSRATVDQELNYEMRTEMDAGEYKTPRARAKAGQNSTATNPATNAPAGEAANKKSVEVKAAEKLGPEIKVENKTEAPKTEEKKTEAPKTSASQMTEDDDPSTMPKSPAEKRANGFFAKRPPLKMKYFK